MTPKMTPKEKADLRIFEAHAKNLADEIDCLMEDKGGKAASLDEMLMMLIAMRDFIAAYKHPSETPKTEAPHPETPKTEAPHPETPKTEAPHPETPKTEAPHTPKPRRPKPLTTKPKDPKNENEND